MAPSSYEDGYLQTPHSAVAQTRPQTFLETPSSDFDPSHDDELSEPTPTSHGDVNFSRKRQHNFSTIEDNVANAEDDVQQDGTHSAKRLRSGEWPSDSEEDNDATPRRPGSSPYRARRSISDSSKKSKFKEASMHDKPSQKPPTLFTRTVSGPADATNTEQLMEDYHREVSGASAVASIVRLPGKLADRQTQVKGLTHHPNMSIGTASQASNATANANESGIYRFGRSIAASFNPFNIWGKNKPGRRNAGESNEEAIARHAREVQLDDQKRRAEETYARMKAEGQFAGPSSKALRNAKSIVDFANHNGYNRDSGI
ncbi:hypothetical protein LTS18_014303, partial [Coniosporium uncinatum]